MKKLLVLFVTMVSLTFALTSCVTNHYEYQDDGDTMNMTMIAVKDYDILGTCTVTTTVTEKQTWFSSSKDGSEVIYPLLLAEAEKMKGHDVINVRITKKEDSSIKLYGIFGKEVTYTYTATALVIAYNNKDLETKAVYDSDGKLTTVVGPVMNNSKTPARTGSTLSVKNVFKKLNIFKK